MLAFKREMLQKTFDIGSLNERLFELLADIQNQIEVTLTQDGIPLATVSPVQSEEVFIPKAGLNRDAMVIANDFNEPLPDDYWGI